MKRPIGILSALLLSVCPLSAQLYPSGSALLPSAFDWDEDGVFGETGDFDVCDGTGHGETTSGGFVVEDYDGDGVDEDQIYVDADGGTDNTTCGLPGSPCLTINHALDRHAGNSGTGAPSAGEGAICAKGTDATSFDLDTRADGAAGTYTIAAGTYDDAGTTTENEQPVAIEVATNPFIIMGWDTDDDNIYPPLDTDDTPYIHNDTTGYAVSVTAGDAASRILLAHLKFFESGHDVSNNGGWLDMSSGALGAGRGEHWRIASVWADRVNYQKCKATGNIVISGFGDKWSDIFIHNNDFTQFYSYFNRGGPEKAGHTFLRNYTTHRAIGGSSGTGDHLGKDCWDGSVTSGAKGNGNLRRIWYNGTGSAAYQWIQNTHIADGYDNTVAVASQLDGGINLCGWQGFHLRGNFYNGYDTMGQWSVSDGVCAGDQDFGDIHITNNTFIVDNATVGVAGGISHNLSGFLPGNAGATNDDLTGEFEFAENRICFTDSNSLSLFTMFYFQPRSTVDMTSGTLSITGNDVVLEEHDATKGVALRTLLTATASIPGTVNFSDNRFRTNDGATGLMIHMTEGGAYDWATEWSDSNSGNIYPDADFENNNTSYTSAASWATAMGHTAPTISNSETITCYTQANGVDYTTGAGGSGPSTPTAKLWLSN